MTQSLDADSVGPPADLVSKIRAWGRQLGFAQLGVTDIDLAADEARLERWLALRRHGEMSYMEKHGAKRSRPALLVPHTVSVISARMNYLTAPTEHAQRSLDQPINGYVSRYALGRDYHKVLRSRLKKLGERIGGEVEAFGFRVFTDSAPVLERGLARKAGLGWFGKHTNLINRQDGSWFFIGEIYTDLALPPDAAYPGDYCGSCVACIDACPTGAIVAPYEVDARLCISYLTIELRGSIPLELRPLIGNRVFGCDDCQLVCPWNRFAAISQETDFSPRFKLDASTLLELFGWTETEFLERTQGSAVRRISFEQWQRNIAVAMGNAPRSPTLLAALLASSPHRSALVDEHVRWAIDRQRN